MPEGEAVTPSSNTSEPSSESFTVPGIQKKIAEFDIGNIPPQEAPNFDNLPESSDPFSGPYVDESNLAYTKSVEHPQTVEDIKPAKMNLRLWFRRMLRHVLPGIRKSAKLAIDPEPQSKVLDRDEYHPNPDATPVDPWGQQDQPPSVIPPTNKSVT